nr:hypothetical protein [Tanacetum cinerariifolium]
MLQGLSAAVIEAYNMLPNLDEDPKLYQLVTDHMMHGPCCADNPSCPCTIKYKCTKKFPRQFNETTMIDDSGYALYKRRNDACEAAWCIYGFEIHYWTPSVERFLFHLNDEQQVIFDATESIDYDVDKSSVNETKFKSWMELNQTDTFARTMLYVEIPKFYVWNLKHRIWTRRKQGKSLGRIHHVPPSWGELYYLCAILNKVRGPMEWDDLKKVDDVLYPTYRDACYARGLLQDDKEYIDGILEASLWGMGDYLRSIFIMLIMTDSMSWPEIVWEKTWMKLAEDNMPYPDQEYTMDGYNGLIYDETSYDKDQLREQHIKLYGSLTTKQKERHIFIRQCQLRSKGDIVLNVASSGIATLLLEGRRIAHSCFAIPINIVEDSMCHIAADSDLADLIRKANLIIWDEAPMINRHCYEAFDRTLQILPVITNGGKQDVFNATINSSYLWEKCTVLRLTVNMRLGSGLTKSKKRNLRICRLDIRNSGSVGTICAIPRMVISLTDTKMPFKLNSRQFPIQVCFAMTINKSQGQTLSQVGLFLRRPVFSHGQLYVAILRVKSKKGLK